MRSDEALKLIQGALYRGRYFLDPHAQKRMAQRHVSFHDVRHAIMPASACQPYRDPKREAKAGTTLWRVNGIDLDGDRLDVGVDLVQDHLGAFVAVITVF